MRIFLLLLDLGFNIINTIQNYRIMKANKSKLKTVKPTIRFQFKKVLSKAGVFKEKVTITRRYFFGLFTTVEILD